MNPAKLIHVIETLCRNLSIKNDEFTNLADTRAEAEKEYKMSVRKQILLHKEEGYAATLIPKLVEGHKQVAELKFKMDVAEALVKANIESCRSLVNQIDAARSLLSWLKSEKEKG